MNISHLHPAGSDRARLVQDGYLSLSCLLKSLVGTADDEFLADLTVLDRDDITYLNSELSCDRTGQHDLILALRLSSLNHDGIDRILIIFYRIGIVIV